MKNEFPKNMEKYWTVNHSLSGVIDFNWEGTFAELRLRSSGLIVKTRKQAEKLLSAIHEAIAPFRMDTPPKSGTKYWSFFIYDKELHAPAEWRNQYHQLKLFYCQGIYGSATLAKSAVAAAIKSAKDFQKCLKK